MRPFPGKRIDTIANICIIIVSLLVSSLFIRNWLRQDTPESRLTTHTTDMLKGATVTLPGVTWNTHQNTIVLALSTHCTYCTQSAPFLRKLISALKHHPNFTLIAVFPQPPDEARRYLNNLAINVDTVIQSSLSLMGISRTPSLLVVDSTGKVLRSYIGRLSRAREEEIMGSLQPATALH